MAIKDNKSIPSHVGFILDGNRRWAREHGLPTLEGHRKGYDNLKEITKAAINSGVSYVSAYIFSTENWSRTPEEVKYLMDLAYRMLTKDLKELNKEQIRVIWLGSEQNISQKLLKAIKKAEDSTKNNTRGTLALCFNYGGHDELVNAIKKIVKSGYEPEEITEEVLSSTLYGGSDIPPVDFIVRTSGEQRLSGFMLHRSAYSELYFTDVFWPDFDEQELQKALTEYGRRQRRFGK